MEKKTILREQEIFTEECERCKKTFQSGNVGTLKFNFRLHKEKCKKEKIKADDLRERFEKRKTKGKGDGERGYGEKKKNG